MMSFDGITVSFGPKKAVDSLSFSLSSHKITVIIGKNGSGKSTLLSCVTGHVKYEGEIRYGASSWSKMTARERAKVVALLPQSLPKAALSVEELVAMGRTPYLDLGKHLTREDKMQIEAAIKAVQLENMASLPIRHLSGGERQRAYLAMVLAQDTKVVILDEPTTYMDMENEASFLELVKMLKTQRQKTLLMVMHDLTKAVELADDILVMENGHSVFFGTSRECVKSGVIERVFGVNRSSYRKDGVERVLYYR